MSQPDANDELLGTLSRLCDGALDEAGFALLAERLKNDPAARRTYIEYLDMHGELRWDDKPATSLDVFADEMDGAVRAPSEPTGLLVRLARRINTPWGVSLLIAGLAVTVGVLSLALTRFPFRDGAAEREFELTTARFVARLTRQHQCVWSEETAAALAEGDDLLAGQWLELNSGAAEIRFDRGAVVVLNAPARFRVADVGRGELTLGEATAIVGGLSAGFTIYTPSATIVDIGTEFGVRVGPQGETDVQVFVGRVEATLVTQGKTATYEIGGEQAMRFDRHRKLAEPSAYLPDGFVRRLEELGRRALAVRNASFEEPQLLDRPWIHQLDAWESAQKGSGAASFGGEFIGGTPHGDQIAFLHTGSLAQTLDAVLLPDTQYELSFLVGNRPDRHKPDFRVELFAGEELLLGEENPVRPEEGRFERVTLTYTSKLDSPGIGEPLRIVFTSLSGLNQDTQNLFDDVRLTAQPVE